MTLNLKKDLSGYFIKQMGYLKVPHHYNIMKPVFR